MSTEKHISEAAKALSSMGASKGGKARAAKLTDQERQSSARTAAIARWDKEKGVPIAEFGGPDKPLRIGNIEIPCYVLSNGMRVITHRGLQRGLDMTISGGAQETVKFLQRLESKGLPATDLVARVSNPIEFRPAIAGRTAFGYEATVLADICDFILAARNALLLNAKGRRIAQRCEILVRGFSRVGIIALVDEATGYQVVRDRLELHKILEAYVSRELLPWSKRFSDEFYHQMFRLRGWSFDPETGKKPILIGKLTEKVVYKKLPRGVLEELKKKNPKNEKGRRRHRYFQFLTDDIGNPHLEKHLAITTALMRASRTWKAFLKLLDRAVPTPGEEQAEMDFMDEEGTED
jgi:hypothetical protein